MVLVFSEPTTGKKDDKEGKTVFMLWGFFVVYCVCIYQDIKGYPKAHITCWSERAGPGI